MAERSVDPNAPTWTSAPGQSSPSAEIPTWAPGPSTLPGPEGPGSATHSSGAEHAAGDPAHMSRAVLPIGTIIDHHYRIEGIIGAGAMGVVYHAHHVRLDRPVALKLQRTVGNDTARLEREARAMARLDHPNVVRVYDVGMHEGDLYIAMEFIAGESLRAWLARGPRPWQQALEVCMQAGRGLMAAHFAGIVHRDFKPDNVLVGHDGRVRVADFGIARGIGAPPPVEASGVMFGLGPDLTRTGAMPGTPAYMAPEQFDGRADARSDVFAFAVVVYEALWGARPFAGDTLPQLFHNLTRGRIRAVPASSPVPPEVLRAVLGGLAIDPRMRTAGMPQLLTQLEQARVPRRSSGVLAAAIAGSAVLGLATIGTAWWLMRPHDPATTIVSAPKTEAAVAPTIESSTPAPPRPPAAIEAAPAPTPAAIPPPALDETQRAGKRALMDLMRGKDADPDALQALLEGDNDEVVSATLAGVMMMDADAHADEGGFRRPGWDGSAMLVCKMGDKFRFEKETFVLEGTAFQTMYGCQLQLIDCDITADVIAHVMLRSELTISGGTLRPKTQVIDQLQGTVVVAGTKIVGTPKLGFGINGGRLDLADVSVTAPTAIKASSDAVVTIVGGRLEGTVAAIDASARAHVTTDKTELVGPTTLASGATLGPVAPP